MSKYLKLQLKRVIRFLPRILCAVLVLLVGLGTVLGAVLLADGESAEKTRFKIAIVGNPQDTYLDMGMAALESFDSSRFAIEVVRMSEPEARTAVENNTVSAYILIPDDFIENAMRGDVEPLVYVTSDRIGGLSAVFKEEITQVISDYVLHAQKGVYGSSDAFRGTGMYDGIPDLMNRFSLEYVGFILRRSELYRVSELGIADALGLAGYFFCGIGVTLLLLVCLSFSVLFVRRDQSLRRVLASRGCGPLRQMGAELISLLAGLWGAVATVFLCLVCVGAFAGDLAAEVFPAGSPAIALLRVFPVTLALAAFSLVVFEAARDLVSGVLLHFFLSLALCYVTGCFYPIYAFPEAVQALSGYLPTGLARSHLAACITGSEGLSSAAGLLCYAVLFFSVAVLLRRRKLIRGRG